MRFTNLLILCFLILLTAFDVSGQDRLSTGDEVRSFNEVRLEELRSNSSFKYDLPTPEAQGAFERFIIRVQNWFMRLFGSGTASSIFDIAWRLLLVAAFIFFIIKLFGIEVSTVFKPNKTKPLNYKVSEEQLHGIDFEQEIAKAIKQNQWRFAVRLIYLHALKILADSELLMVKKGKTNREYLYELAGKPVEEDFKRLSFIFDYTWYGHFEANDRVLSEAKEHFDNIHKENRFLGN